MAEPIPPLAPVTSARRCVNALSCHTDPVGHAHPLERARSPQRRHFEVVTHDAMRYGRSAPVLGALWQVSTGPWREQDTVVVAKAAARLRSGPATARGHPSAPPEKVVRDAAAWARHHVVVIPVVELIR
jgi:hypothetical protein